MLCSFHVVKMAGIEPFLLELWLREGVDQIRSLSAAIMHTDSIQDLESSHCCFGEETSFKSLSSISVGEVWFGLVWGTFCQTGNQTVRFFSDFQKPKPKLHQTVWCGFKWFQTRFKPKLFKKKFTCNNLFTLHNFVVYLLQIYLIYIKLHIDGCPEEKR